MTKIGASSNERKTKNRERQARWRKNNQGKDRAHSAAWKINNPEKVRAWLKNNPEKVHAHRVTALDSRAYVQKRLKNSTGLTDAPAELIEAKRTHLKMVRTLREK